MRLYAGQKTSTQKRITSGDWKNHLFALILATVAAAYAEPLLIDLPTALRLADEKNTDLAIQVQKVAQAELDKSAAWCQWITTLRVGASYGAQNGALQETDGTIIDVERNSRYAGMGAGAYGAGMRGSFTRNVLLNMNNVFFQRLENKKRRTPNHGTPTFYFSDSGSLVFFEEPGGEVAFPGVGDDRDDQLAFVFRLLCQFKRRKHISAR